MSYNLTRDGTPCFFKAGVTARVMAPFPCFLFATTKGTLNGSSPRSIHSHDAKKLFKSIHIIFLFTYKSSIILPPNICLQQYYMLLSVNNQFLILVIKL